MNRELRELLAELDKQGFKYKVTKKGHVMIKTADNKPVTTFSGTPSDIRSWKNSISRLKRAGFEDEG